MSHKVNEISISLGVTRSLGAKTYEFARIDVTNKMVLDEPLDIDSKEYRMAHKKLLTSMELILEKAEAQIVPADAAAS